MQSLKEIWTDGQAAMPDLVEQKIAELQARADAGKMSPKAAARIAGYMREEVAEAKRPAPANPDNSTVTATADPEKERLEKQQRRLGGDVVWNDVGKFFFLRGCTYKGEFGHVYVGLKSKRLEFFKKGEKKGTEIYEKRGDPTVATPFSLRDTSEIPPREFLHAGHYVRKYLTATVGAGGGGKSSLSIVEALAMVTGRPLLDPDGPLSKPLRVWLVNIEDPAEEIERRVAAAAKHFNITNDQIGGRLFIDSGRDQSFVIMQSNGREIKLCEPLVEELVEEIGNRQIDVMIVDPFVSTHEVNENDNSAIQQVASAWVSVANAANCSIEIVHHITKGEREVTADSARGGGALKDKVRSMRTINLMTEAEAVKAGLEDHNGYFRVGFGKANMTKKTKTQRWHRLVSVPLMNGKERQMNGKSIGRDPGDEIGVVERWFWPSADVLAEKEAEARAAVVAGVPEAVLAGIKVRLDNGSFKESSQADSWAGKLIAELLDIDLVDKEEKARVKEMLAAWVEMGELQITVEPDAYRRQSKFIRPCAAPEN